MRINGDFRIVLRRYRPASVGGTNPIWVNMTLLLVSVAACAALIEFFLAASPLYDRRGWNRVPQIPERVRTFNGNAPIKIVALGDSFADWRLGEGRNMFDYAQKALASKGCALLNLGSSGTDPVDYIELYKRYVHFKPDCIILCLYLGNDFNAALFKYPPQQPPQFSLRGEVVNFLRTHTVLGSLTVEFLRRNFGLLRSGFFLKYVETIRQRKHMPDELFQRRMHSIDPKILEMARNDEINPYLLAEAFEMPSYYKEVFGVRPGAGRQAVDETLTQIIDFFQKVRVRDFVVVMIPESIQLSYYNDEFFKKCGFDLEQFPLNERRQVTRYCITRLREAGMHTLDLAPFLEKETNAYIPFDTHFNAAGQGIAGRQIISFLEKDVLPELTPRR